MGVITDTTKTFDILGLSQKVGYGLKRKVL